MDFWQFVTDLGDSAVTLPLVALTLLFLLQGGARRPAVALAVSLSAGGLAVGILKLALQSCGRRLLDTSLVNPSGHVAVSAMAYGGLALVLGGGLSGVPRQAAYGGFIALVAGIAASRTVLHVHNPGEVLAGLAVGLAALALYGRTRGVAKGSEASTGRLTLAALLLVVAMHGTRWPIEEQIRSLVALIRAGVPACA